MIKREEKARGQDKGQAGGLSDACKMCRFGAQREHYAATHAFEVRQHTAQRDANLHEGSGNAEQGSENEESAHHLRQEAPRGSAQRRIDRRVSTQGVFCVAWGQAGHSVARRCSPPCTFDLCVGAQSLHPVGER